MVNPDSDLFRAHPDWAIGVPGRSRTESRQQLVLDLSRPEVVDHIADALVAVLSSAPIEYVKWDMNRNITEPWTASLPADRQGEFFHRYILGVYELYRRLTARFPDILFESCAGGGGRFDAGMLAFAPQAWTSDDTDAAERLPIQWGTSLAFPVSSMAAHVSAVPNHQTGRITPLFTRAAVAMFGAFGYELDPTSMPEAEQAEVARQIAWYLERRQLLQGGRFLRLRSPFEGDGNETAWMAVDEGGSHAVVGFYRILARPGPAAEPAPAARARPGGDLPRHDLDGHVRGARRDGRASGRRAAGGRSRHRAARHAAAARRVARRHPAGPGRLPGTAVRAPSRLRAAAGRRGWSRMLAGTGPRPVLSRARSHSWEDR